jgi:hypothetical protein
MIDFAHSTYDLFLNDRRYFGVDEGYLLGIGSLISTVDRVIPLNRLPEA